MKFLRKIGLLSGLLVVSVGWPDSRGYGAEETSVGQVKFLSGNLLANGGFENVGGNRELRDWTITLDKKDSDLCVVEVDNSIKHRGKSSLKLTFSEEAGNVTVIVKSTAFSATPGKLYRVAGWVRHEGFVKEREVGYDIISLHDAGGYYDWKFHANNLSNFDWRFVERLMGPATNDEELALTLMLHAYKGKPVVWFDDFVVQEYNPPPAPAKPKAWVYPTRADRCVGGNVVDDPDGTGGKSFKVTALDGSGGKIQGAIIAVQPAGLYRATFRLKVADTDGDSIHQLGMVIYSHGMDGACRALPQGEFNEANKYQNFTLDFILPSVGIGPCFTYGIGGKNPPDLWIDTVTITQLLEFTDETMVEFYGD